MAYDKAYLEEAMLGYSHRPDLVVNNKFFIPLAEAMINKDLRVREMELRFPVTFIDTFYDMPDDYLEMRSLHIESAGARIPLDQLPSEILDKRYSRSTGRPRAFTMHGNEIELRPGLTNTGSPLISYEAEITYYQKVDEVYPGGLNTNPTSFTNAILENYPLIYISACLIQLYLYIQDTEQMGIWASAFENQIEAANSAANKGRYSRPSIQIA